MSIKLSAANQQTAFTTYKWRHYNEKLLMMLAAILVLGLTACGQSDVNSSNNVEESKTNTTESKTEETTPATDKASEDTESAQNDTMKNEKILVAYFSASGNTERIAEIIANATGANTFEIVPENPYSNDDLNWRDESSRVCREHDNPDERDIALQIVTPDEWESYSIVYVGACVIIRTNQKKPSVYKGFETGLVLVILQHKAGF